MATKRGAKKYLASLETALLQGTGWRNPQIFEDVLKIAHLLRCLKLCCKLAKSYLCIRHPAQDVYVVVPVEDVPHHSIRKLDKEEAVDYTEAVGRALLGVNAELSHITFVKFQEENRLELLVYFEAASKMIMQEKKCTYSQVPEVVAMNVKAAGHSAKKNDLITSMHIARDRPIFEELLVQTGGRKPSNVEVANFLRLVGQPVTEDIVQGIVIECTKAVIHRSVENFLGSSSKSMCQNPSCSVDIRGKRKICGTCQRVAYCSDRCQKEDWRHHAPSCSNNLVAIYDNREYLKDMKDYMEVYGLGSVFA